MGGGSPRARAEGGRERGRGGAGRWPAWGPRAGGAPGPPHWPGPRRRGEEGPRRAEAAGPGAGAASSSGSSSPPAEGAGAGPWDQNLQFAEPLGPSGGGGSPKPPRFRVRFRVEYRCHSRQALAMAGSFSPLGWSFLSIAKMAMSWNEGDAWTKDAEFPLGAMLEYKYVVLEDQDWTKLQDEGAEGVVTTFRSNSEDSDSDDVDSIVRQMAIVAWQPGANRIVQLPDAVPDLSAGVPEPTRLDGSDTELRWGVDEATGEPVLTIADFWAS